MRRTRSSAGVALVEALVAMAVMAFGLLSVVGMQATLRQNADVAKQRAEAVRIAQAEIEGWRTFAVLPVQPNTSTYAGLVSGTLTATNGSNTQFTLSRNVTDAFDGAYKVLTIDVNWLDRSNATQAVRMSTALHGVAPELAATASVLPNGLPTAQAGGRNSAIPWSAIAVSGSSSAYRPPQPATGNDVVWVFNNVTGLITVCRTSEAATATLNLSNIKNCGSDSGQLLSGYVNFADTSVAATAQQAVSPTGDAQAVQVQIHVTAPAEFLVGQGAGCYTDAPIAGHAYVKYQCAVPVSKTNPSPWSGYAYVLGQAAGQSVCRYTRYPGNQLVPAIQNSEHPNAYVNVSAPLANQNFLVVKTASGTAGGCPDGSPLPANTTTVPQPATP